MSTITISFDFLICETSSNSFLCKFYYWDSVNLRIRPWTAIQSSKQDALALMQQFSNDLYTALLNIDGITPLGGGSITDYGSYSEMSNSITIDLSSQSQDIDYTQILTSINSNLASIAANSGSIANKDNQSDIVSCLQDIFMYTASDTNNKVSAMKCENLSGHNENYLKSVNVIFQMRKLVNCLSSLDRDFNQPVENNNKEIYNISRKLANAIPNVSDFNNKTILRELSEISRKISFDYASSSDSDISIYKQLLNLKESVKNSNDLHTISQAIDLISTAIAQIPPTDVSGLTSAVQNLKLEQNNLIQVEGDIDYRIKYDKNKDE